MVLDIELVHNSTDCGFQRHSMYHPHPGVTITISLAYLMR